MILRMNVVRRSWTGVGSMLVTLAVLPSLPALGAQAAAGGENSGEPALARFREAAASSPWKDIRSLVGDVQGEVFTGHEEKSFNELYKISYRLEPSFRAMIDEEVVDRKFEPVDCRDIFDGKDWFRTLDKKQVIRRSDIRRQTRQRMGLTLLLLAAGPGLAHGPFVLRELGEGELDGHPTVRLGVRFEEGHPLDTGSEHEVVLDAQSWEPRLVYWTNAMAAAPTGRLGEGDVAPRRARKVPWKPVAMAEGEPLPHALRWEFRGSTALDERDEALEREEAKAQGEENPQAQARDPHRLVDPNRLRRRLTIHVLEVNPTLDDSLFQASG